VHLHRRSLQVAGEEAVEDPRPSASAILWHRLRPSGPRAHARDVAPPTFQWSTSRIVSGRPARGCDGRTWSVKRFAQRGVVNARNVRCRGEQRQRVARGRSAWVPAASVTWPSVADGTPPTVSYSVTLTPCGPVTRRPT
jgi:hypothetical protein